MARNNRIILNLAASLDGYIADGQGGYDWIKPAGRPEANTAAVWSHERFLEHVSTVVMGRRCFEAGMHLDYPEKQVYVATSRPPADEGNLHFFGGDVAGAVAKLRVAAAGDVYLFGGGLVIEPILRAGLIDEYVIGIIPVILGGGIPLFRPGHAPVLLQLTHTYVEDGIVVLRYVPRPGPAEA